MKVLILRWKSTPEYIEALYVVNDDEAKAAQEAAQEMLPSEGYELIEMTPDVKDKETWLEEFASVINPPSDPHPNGN